MNRPVKVLPVLTTLFAASIFGRSIALAVEDSDKTLTDSALEEPMSKVPPSSAEPVIACVSPTLGDALKKRQAELEISEQDLLDKLAAQRLVKEELDRSMAEIDALAAIVEEKVDLLETASRQDIVHLTKMYENMKPAQASGIFNKMDPIFAAGIFHGMKSNQAGLILANMAPDKAYVISVLMANRLAEYRETDPS